MTTAKHLAPLWIALLALFTYRAATTGAFHEPSTCAGIVAGGALVGVAWLIGRRRERNAAE